MNDSAAPSTSTALPDGARAVLDFWFGAPGSAEAGQYRKAWFIKDAAFDAQILGRFAPLLEAALAGGLAGWSAAGPEGALARILLLDQFTRNSYRGTARAFAGDPQALAQALSLVDSVADRQLTPLQRLFVYLPLEHAEDLALQQRCVALFETLAAEDARLDGALDYARRHHAVIAQFGRFPHRNAALGRASSEAELAYLAQPGSGF
ncbi:UNVERIFIED_ORG: DUF924 domain-containing protein [Shinella sp. XGS7]|nr:DUF924 family protein [Shinella sp. XGS7]